MDNRVSDDHSGLLRQCSCGSDSAVIDSRDQQLAPVIRRRRECLACKRRWTTYEVSADTYTKLQQVENFFGLMKRSL